MGLCYRFKGSPEIISKSFMSQSAVLISVFLILNGTRFLLRASLGKSCDSKISFILLV